MIDTSKYSFLKPMPGFVVLKEVEPEVGRGALAKVSEVESRAYGYVVALPATLLNAERFDLHLGDLVCYNEFEGQELFKHGRVQEDHIIVLKVENIILKIEEDESNTQSNGETTI